MFNFYRDFKFASLLAGIICVLVLIINLFLGDILSLKGVGKTILLNAYYAIPLSLLNGWLFDYQSRHIPWDKSPKKRAIYGVIGSFLVTMGGLLVLNFILWTLIWGNPVNVLWIKENRTFYLISFVITLLVTITLHAIGFFKEIQRERIVNAQLREEKLRMELSALRTQVDPHFLFNSFNVLSGLIEENKEKAQEFLTGLSKIYRYTLEQKDDDTNTVQDELSFAQQYLRLQQMRFEDSICITTRLSPAILDKKIPSLSLQLLLENAVKHNGFDEQDPLKIEILEEGDHLVVRNNRKARKNLVDSNGLGLQNISDRYQLLMNKAPLIEAEEDSFTVKIPLI